LKKRRKISAIFKIGHAGWGHSKNQGGRCETLRRRVRSRKTQEETFRSAHDGMLDIDTSESGVHLTMKGGEKRVESKLGKDVLLILPGGRYVNQA